MSAVFTDGTAKCKHRLIHRKSDQSTKRVDGMGELECSKVVGDMCVHLVDWEIAWIPPAGGVVAGPLA